ncbi:DUF342 domain-containing protein [Limisalsivibrio acetivorans]|uniref:DUF342 domain-containing protein n=1 Tax=Limisalsivibrio acetivorans TaxID=1304888 RepID=UPI0003B51D87|nr:FapA family protein [Limisalsivibrio acetivorans]
MAVSGKTTIRSYSKCSRTELKRIIAYNYGCDPEKCSIRDIEGGRLEAELPEILPIDSKVEVKKGKDSMSAEIYLYPALAGGECFTIDGLTDILEYDEGLCRELFDMELLENLAEAVAEGFVVQGEVFIRGYDAKHGINGWYEKHFADLKPVPEEDEHGRVDFRNLLSIINVREGEPLITLHPPTDGEAGKNIFGKELPALKGKAEYISGVRGVRMDEETETLVADRDGHVLFDGEEVIVSPVYEVKGNVDLSVGNVEFSETVIIHGDVLPGFHVKGRDIRVFGIVRDAVLEAAEDIFVKVGIKGGNSRISAGRNVTSGYIENAHVCAGGDIEILRHCYNSTLTAGRGIYATGSKCVVCGGHYSAFECFEAKCIGARSVSGFTIEVGIRQGLEEQVQALMKNKEELGELLRDADGRIKELAAKNNRIHENPGLKRVISARKLLLSRYEGMSDRVAEAIEESLHPQPYIAALDTIHEGVSLRIYGTELRLSSNMKKARFYFDKDKQGIMFTDHE